MAAAAAEGREAGREGVGGGCVLCGVMWLSL